MQKEETSKCGVMSTLLFLEQFAEKKLCGKCVPCRVGTMQAINIINRIIAGLGDRGDINLLLSIADRMSKSSMCKLGKDVGKELDEYINKCRSVYEEHIWDGLCKEFQCTKLITYKVNPDLCNMCDACRKVCESEAIVGEPAVEYLTDNMPYQILDIKCNKCGKCLEACPQKAIEICRKDLRVLV